MLQTANIDDQLRDVFSAFPSIKLVILFGSVASGKAHAQSDLDVAVVGARPLGADDKIHIIEALALKTGRPVDLVDLHDSPEPITGQVLKHGRRIFGANTAYAELLSRHLVEQADFVPLQERILSERRIAWIGK